MVLVVSVRGGSGGGGVVWGLPKIHARRRPYIPNPDIPWRAASPRPGRRPRAASSCRRPRPCCPSRPPCPRPAPPAPAAAAPPRPASAPPPPPPPSWPPCAPWPVGCAGAVGYVCGWWSGPRHNTQYTMHHHPESRTPTHLGPLPLLRRHARVVRLRALLPALLRRLGRVRRQIARHEPPRRALVERVRQQLVLQPGCCFCGGFVFVRGA